MRRAMLTVGGKKPFVTQGTLVAGTGGTGGKNTGYGNVSNGNFGSYTGTIYNGRTCNRLDTNGSALTLIMTGTTPTQDTHLVIMQGASEVLNIVIPVANWAGLGGASCSYNTIWKFTSGQTYGISLT